MTVKDFDAMLAERAGVRPTFKVSGQEFQVRSKLPYKKFQSMMAAMTAEGADTDAATDEFFRAVITKADRDRFLALLNDDGEDDEDRVIDPAQMGAIIDWLISLYTGKAHTSSASSSDGPNPTGLQRNVVSLSPRNVG